jgi:hypothetical protein
VKSDLAQGRKTGFGDVLEILREDSAVLEI